jgi:hypothetical protein
MKPRAPISVSKTHIGELALRGAVEDDPQLCGVSPGIGEENACTFVLRDDHKGSPLGK